MSPVLRFPRIAFLKIESELLFDKLIKESGQRIIGFWYGWPSYCQPSADPDVIQLVLSKEFTSFPNRTVPSSAIFMTYKVFIKIFTPVLVLKINDPLFGSFLSTAIGGQWKRLRSYCNAHLFPREVSDE